LFITASLADFAENRNAWREVVSAAADLDVLQAFAVHTGPKGDRASGSPGSFSR
jgi:predicted TIM-barrel fold metal-dependent hydrolase